VPDSHDDDVRVPVVQHLPHTTSIPEEPSGPSKDEAGQLTDDARHMNALLEEMNAQLHPELTPCVPSSGTPTCLPQARTAASASCSEEDKQPAVAQLNGRGGTAESKAVTVPRAHALAPARDETSADRDRLGRV
jgi:hypothetical protein